jgi:hypothetical protein
MIFTHYLTVKVLKDSLYLLKKQNKNLKKRDLIILINQAVINEKLKVKPEFENDLLERDHKGIIYLKDITDFKLINQLKKYKTNEIFEVPNNSKNLTTKDFDNSFITGIPFNNNFGKNSTSGSEDDSVDSESEKSYYVANNNAFYNKPYTNNNAFYNKPYPNNNAFYNKPYPNNNAFYNKAYDKFEDYNVSSEEEEEISDSESLEINNPYTNNALKVNPYTNNAAIGNPYIKNALPYKSSSVSTNDSIIESNSSNHNYVNKNNYLSLPYLKTKVNLFSTNNKPTLFVKQTPYLPNTSRTTTNKISHFENKPGQFPIQNKQILNESLQYLTRKSKEINFNLQNENNPETHKKLKAEYLELQRELKNLKNKIQTAIDQEEKEKEKKKREYEEYESLIENLLDKKENLERTIQLETEKIALKNQEEELYNQKIIDFNKEIYNLNAEIYKDNYDTNSRNPGFDNDKLKIEKTLEILLNEVKKLEKERDQRNHQIKQENYENNIFINEKKNELNNVVQEINKLFELIKNSNLTKVNQNDYYVNYYPTPLYQPNENPKGREYEKIIERLEKKIKEKEESEIREKKERDTELKKLREKIKERDTELKKLRETINTLSINKSNILEKHSSAVNKETKEKNDNTLIELNRELGVLKTLLRDKKQKEDELTRKNKEAYREIEKLKKQNTESENRERKEIAELKEEFEKQKEEFEKQKEEFEKEKEERENIKIQSEKRYRIKRKETEDLYQSKRKQQIQEIEKQKEQIKKEKEEFEKEKKEREKSRIQSEKNRKERRKEMEELYKKERKQQKEEFEKEKEEIEKEKKEREKSRIQSEEVYQKKKNEIRIQSEKIYQEERKKRKEEFESEMQRENQKLTDLRNLYQTTLNNIKEQENNERIINEKIDLNNKERTKLETKIKEIELNNARASELDELLNTYNKIENLSIEKQDLLTKIQNNNNNVYQFIQKFENTISTNNTLEDQNLFLKKENESLK